MARGKIARLFDKGFGFIKPDEPNSKDLFFHVTEVKNCDFNHLKIGDVVKYEEGENTKGPCAKKINKVV